MSSSDSLVPPRPGLRRWLIFLLVLVTALVGGYWVLLDVGAQREVDRVMAELDRTDPEWRLEEIELSRPIVPVERDSAVLVRKLILELSRPGIGLLLRETYLANLQPERRLTESQLQTLQAALAPLAQERAEALRLKDLPQGHFPIKYHDDYIGTDLSLSLSARRLWPFLRCDAYLRAEEADLAGAVAACRALLNAIRSVGDEPMILTQLDRLAGHTFFTRTLERVLAQGEAPEADLKDLQALVEREADEPILLHALRGARAGAGRVYGTFDEGPGQSTNPSYAAHLRLMTRAVEACKLPAEKQLAAMEEIEASLSDQPLLVQRLLPPLGKVTKVSVQSQAELRCALLALAAERYRLGHKSWPKAAEELVGAGLLRAVLIDPFDGMPLRWRQQPEGPVAYSVSHDKADDQGRIDRDSPIAPNTDLGFRLWNPEARRQPAP